MGEGKGNLGGQVFSRGHRLDLEAKAAPLADPLTYLKGKGGLRRVIRLERIYNFLCSMLVFTPFALCFVTLRGIFMRFPELTY
jgi:hypothetical protein